MMDCRYSNTPTKGNYKLNVVEDIKPYPVKEKADSCCKADCSYPGQK